MKKKHCSLSDVTFLNSISLDITKNNDLPSFSPLSSSPYMSFPFCFFFPLYLPLSLPFFFFFLDLICIYFPFHSRLLLLPSYFLCFFSYLPLFHSLFLIPIFLHIFFISFSSSYSLLSATYSLFTFLSPFLSFPHPILYSPPITPNSFLPNLSF